MPLIVVNYKHCIFTTLEQLSMKKPLFLFVLVRTGICSLGQAISPALNQKVIQWRKEIHQNPELSNREFNTAKKVASHMRSLGIEVKTGIAHTGVVGILKGKRAGKVIALRADMDALPVTERNNLPTNQMFAQSTTEKKRVLCMPADTIPMWLFLWE